MGRMNALLASVMAVILTAAAFAGEFNWRQKEGTTIKVMLCQHPYFEGYLKQLDDFEKLTGIKVEYSMTPEENYFDRLTTNFASGSGDPDVFTYTSIMVWTYAASGYPEDLTDYPKNAAITNPDYKFDDFYPNAAGLFRWDTIPGHMPGSGKQWGIPVASEYMALMYNKEVLDRKGLKPPTTMDELYTVTKALNEFEGPGTYGLAVRGNRHQDQIPLGYATFFYNMGGRDVAIENGRLVSRVNSPESVRATEKWLEIIKAGGPPQFLTQTWAQCGSDLGARKAAMIFDASNLAYYHDFPGASQESGKLAWSPAPVQNVRDWKTNYISWGVGINGASKNKEAAWLFVQYFTGRAHQLWSATEWKGIDPTRQSVFNDPKYQEIAKRHTGFAESFDTSAPHMFNIMTPHPFFNELTTAWAATIQDIYMGRYNTVQEGMDRLAETMNDAFEELGEVE